MSMESKHNPLANAAPLAGEATALGSDEPPAAPVATTTTMAVLPRPPRNASGAQRWVVTLGDGRVIHTHHPPIATHQDVMTAKANNNAWTSEGAHVHPYHVARTIGGKAGLVCTSKNCCLAFATYDGCTYDRCNRFHAEPGTIVSNLPGRDYEVIGTLNPRLSNNRKLKGILQWDGGQLTLIREMKQAQFIVRSKALEVKRAKAMADQSDALEYQKLLDQESEFTEGQGPPKRRLVENEASVAAPASPYSEQEEYVASPISPTFSPNSPTISPASPADVADVVD